MTQKDKRTMAFITAMSHKLSLPKCVTITEGLYRRIITELFNGEYQVECSIKSNTIRNDSVYLNNLSILPYIFSKLIQNLKIENIM